MKAALLDTLGADWAPHAPVPEGIAVENLRKRGFDFLRLRIQVQGSLHALVPAALILSVVVAVAGYVFNFLTFAVPLGVAIAAVAGMAFKSSRRPKAWTITVLPDKLSITDGTFVGAEAKETVLPFSEIESVRVHNVPGSGIVAHSLLIAGAKSSAWVGGGLPPEALHWLRGFLIMEITGLTWKPIFDVGRRTTRKRANPADLPSPSELLPKRVIDAFLDHAPQTVDKLRAGVEKKDAFKIKREAHWLKSSGANVGAAQFSELCQLMEIHALNNELEKAELLWSDVEREFAQLVGTLQTMDVEDVPPARAATAPESLPRYDVRRSRKNPTSSIGAVVATPRPAAPAVFDASILLVEDSPVNQAVAEEFLSEFGCQVEIAQDGPDALATFERARFDMILMDCQMPGMDGFEATRQLRQKETDAGHSPIPIIALTANALRGDRDQCLAAGMDDYISKPYAPETIRAVLEKWLPHKRGGANPPAASDAVLAEAVADAEFAAVAQSGAAQPGDNRLPAE